MTTEEKSSTSSSDAPTYVSDKDKEEMSTEDRFAVLEKNIDKLGALLETSVGAIRQLAGKVDKPSIEKAVSAEERIKLMNQLKKPGDTAERQGVRDLLHPRATEDGFQPDDIVEILPTSPLHAAYQLDEKDNPVKAIYEFVCEGCSDTEEYKGTRTRKVCPSCKAVMIKTHTGTFQTGVPAQGVVIRYLYTTKKHRGSQRKYKIKFPAFEPEGLLESELVRVG